MSERHSTPAHTPGKPDKPSKPTPDFPLFPHASGQWAKKIRGRLHYFGVWTAPQAALDKYLVNAFLFHKETRVDTGELSPRTWADYKEVCDLLVKDFGKARLVADLGPDDFAALRQRMAKRWGPIRLGNAIQRVRSVFKYAADGDLIDRAVRFGPGFSRPSAKTLRLHKAAQGPKLFTADEVRRLIGAADQPLKAMALLGINCAYGIADCGNLPLSALDLDRGWADFPRPKTGIPRRCPLWGETVQAIREALAARPRPKSEEHAGLVFLTAQGLPWAKTGTGSPMVYKVTTLLKALGINGRKGLGFYTLRHTHRTVADEARDQPAADFIMGHARDDMASVYRERIADDRLRAVVEHVRAWLFGAPKDKAEAKEPKTEVAAPPQPRE
jgi:integrase